MINFKSSSKNLPEVIALCTSKGGIPKLPRDSVYVREEGIEGDGHNHAKHCSPLQAVCLQDVEILEDLTREGFMLFHGAIGENVTLKNANIQKYSLGTILRFSGGVVLELTKERKPCYVLDVVDERLKEVIIGRCGVYAKVLREGPLTVKETVEILRPQSRIF